MSRQMSLADLKVLYEQALYERAHIHNTILVNIDNLRECQNLCRSCGCKNDGTFVEMDAIQKFEFEPSITCYRVLFQRTSLQFAFSSMPDMPRSICARCCEKIKIFYLMTRQCIINQNALRSSITGHYRQRYSVEPPETLEERNQLHKQLAQAKQRPMLESPEHDNKRPRCFASRPRLMRSRSTEIRFPVGQRPNRQECGVMNKRINKNGSKTARSNYSKNLYERPAEMPPNQPKPAAQRPEPQPDRNITPRYGRKDCSGGESSRSNACMLETPVRPVIPPSRAQQQNQLKERYPTWR